MAKIAFFLRLLQLATREPVRALRVKLPELPTAHAHRYEKFFGVPVQHGASPSISFSATDALRPFITR